jgi:hypothetical protein
MRKMLKLIRAMKFKKNMPSKCDNLIDSILINKQLAVSVQKIFYAIVYYVEIRYNLDKQQSCSVHCMRHDVPIISTSVVAIVTKTDPNRRFICIRIRQILVCIVYVDDIVSLLSTIAIIRRQIDYRNIVPIVCDTF